MSLRREGCLFTHLLLSILYTWNLSIFFHYFDTRRQASTSCPAIWLIFAKFASWVPCSFPILCWLVFGVVSPSDPALLVFSLLVHEKKKKKNNSFSHLRGDFWVPRYTMGASGVVMMNPAEHCLSSWARETGISHTNWNTTLIFAVKESYRCSRPRDARVRSLYLHLT